MSSKRAVFFTAFACVLGVSSLARAEARTATASGSMEDHKALLDRINRRLDEIEGKIVITKEKVDVLRDTVLTGQAARTKVIIVHRNEMGNAFMLERATYRLDGETLFNKEDTGGGLDALKEFEIFNGAMGPGSHEITVDLVFSGSAFGVFTYAKGYKFNVHSTWRFNASDGRLTRIAVVSYAKGDITTQTTNKIAIRYDMDINSVPQPSEEGKTTSPQDVKPADDAKPQTQAQPQTPSQTQPPADTKATPK